MGACVLGRKGAFLAPFQALKDGESEPRESLPSLEKAQRVPAELINKSALKHFRFLL